MLLAGTLCPSTSCTEGNSDNITGIWGSMIIFGTLVTYVKRKNSKCFPFEVNTKLAWNSITNYIRWGRMKLGTYLQVTYKESKLLLTLMRFQVLKPYNSNWWSVAYGNHVIVIDDQLCMARRTIYLSRSRVKVTISLLEISDLEPCR